MDIINLLSFILNLILGIGLGYVFYQLKLKKYDLNKIVKATVGNTLKQTLGVKGSELTAATRKIERDVMAIMNQHPEELEEFLPGAKEYIDKGRPDLAVGGILGFIMKVLPIFINQSPKTPEGVKTAVGIASQVASAGALEQILSLVDVFRNRTKKPRAEKSTRTSDNKHKDTVVVPDTWA